MWSCAVQLFPAVLIFAPLSEIDRQILRLEPENVIIPPFAVITP